MKVLPRLMRKGSPDMWLTNWLERKQKLVKLITHLSSSALQFAIASTTGRHSERQLNRRHLSIYLRAVWTRVKMKCFSNRGVSTIILRRATVTRNWAILANPTYSQISTVLLRWLMSTRRCLKSGWRKKPRRITQTDTRKIESKSLLETRMKSRMAAPNVRTRPETLPGTSPCPQAGSAKLKPKDRSNLPYAKSRQPSNQSYLPYKCLPKSRFSSISDHQR